MGDQHGGGRGSDGVDAVVFGVPDAFVAGGFGDLGKLDAAGEALGDCFPVADGGEVENRDGNGAVDRGNSSLVSGGGS
jgi:hypothetical protein